MSRTKIFLRQLERTVGEYAVTEKTTLKQTLPDGTIIRTDEDRSVWSVHSKRGCSSWRGVPPKEWDETKAIREDNERTYTVEIDYS